MSHLTEDTTRLVNLRRPREERFEQEEDVPAEERCPGPPESTASLGQRSARRKEVAGANRGPKENGREADHGARPEKGRHHPPTSFPLGAGAEPIPGYRLVRRLGRGGFGEVWEAEGARGGRCAVKLIPAALEAGEKDKAEIELNGVEKLMGVSSPWKMTVERYEMAHGHLVVVTDLADGSLEDRLHELRKQGSDPQAIAECVRQLEGPADLLDQISLDHGLTHGDVKPGNLLMLGGICVVSDFGTVAAMRLGGSAGDVLLCVRPEDDPDAIRTRRYHSLAQVAWGKVAARGATVVTGAGSFTPYYAPPEAFTGLGSRSFDQYSLAITFCELAFDTIPFHGGLEEQIMQRRRGELGVGFLPLELRPVIARALAAEPDERFPSCADFMAALRSACRLVPAVAESLGEWEE